MPDIVIAPKKQPNTIVELNENNRVITESYIGTDNQISALAYSHKAGSTYLSGQVVNSRFEKLNADQSKWTVTYRIGTLSAVTPDPQDPPDTNTIKVLRETWSSTMAQFSYPLEKYLTSTEAAQLKGWEDLPDMSMKADYVYPAAEGEYDSLTGRALAIAKLKWQGTNEVIKYYPQATRTTTYNNSIISNTYDYKTRGAKLNHIDNTPSVVFKGDAFAVSWLKVGFDWTQNSDGTWTLVESWLGAPTADGGWNTNLYGPNQWEFKS